MNILNVKKILNIDSNTNLINLYKKDYTLFGNLKIPDPLKNLNTPYLILGCLFSINLNYNNGSWYLPVFKNNKYLDLQNNINPILKLKLSSNTTTKITIHFDISFDNIDTFYGIRYYFLNEDVNYSGINSSVCSSRFSTNSYCLCIVYYYGITSYFINEPNFNHYLIKNESDNISDEIRKIDDFLMQMFNKNKKWKVNFVESA